MGVALQAVYEPGTDARADVLFVHGLEGDARSTWQRSALPDHFWPGWLQDDAPQIAVWTLAYDAPVSAWRSASSPLIDLAADALSVLEAHRLGTRPLILVTHSLGGLLVKQIARQAISYGNVNWKSLHDHIAGIVFLSTPHAGSDVANWFRHVATVLRTSVSVKELEAHNAQLRDLNLWFRHHVQQTGIPIQVYFEGRATRGLQVVNATSADPGISGVTPIMLDEDHVSIAKPESRSSILYLRVLRFLDECLSANKGGEEPGETTAIRTFLIADVRGYTRFTVEQGDEAAAQLAQRFAALVGEVVTSRDGRVIELRGDEALAVFTSARQALRAALGLQKAFGSGAARGNGSTIPVGIGLDAGEAIPVDGGYRGAALNLAARLCSLAGPGEVLASDTVANLARKVEGVAYSERGLVELKGFADPVRVMQVVPAGESVAVDQSDAGPTAPVSVAPQSLPIGGFLGSLPPESLVARKDELARLLELIDGVGPGAGQLVLLAGEPGAGKTRLAQEITITLHQRGFLIGAGRCYEPQQVVPYFPFIDALSTLFAHAPASLRQEAAKRFPYLGQLLPDEVGTAPVVTPGDVDNQPRFFRAVTGFLAALTESSPVAILLDDLHWADQASLDLLGHLTRHTRHAPILVLGTYRDVEVKRRHPLEGTLRGLHRDGLLERIEVRRLDQEDTAALMAALFGEAEISADFASLVYRHTEGNPFFTREVLQTLVDRGDVFQRDGIWERKEVTKIEVPESVRSALDERIARLDEATQEILSEASVLGQSFSFADLEVMGGRTETAVETALEEAMEVGLVRETDRDGYAFNHALTHQALYADLPTRKRRRLHRAAGEAIEQLPERKRAERAVELARHFLEADEPEKALHYSLVAGDRAETVFAHVEAELHYREALALAAEIGDEQREAQAEEKIGRMLVAVARYDEAMLRLEHAVARYRSTGDLAAAGRATAWLGLAYRWLGAAEKGIACVQPMIQDLGDAGPPDVLGVLYVSLAHLYFLSGQYEEVLLVAERASAIAQASGDSTVLAEARERYGAALVMLDRPGEGRQILEEVLPLVETTGNLELLRRTVQNIGAAAALAGDIQGARCYIQRSLEIAERIGNPDQIAFALANLAVMLMNKGDWVTARPYLDRAAELARSGQVTANASVPIKLQASLMLDQGEWEEARPLVDEAVRLAEQTGNRQAREQALALAGLLDVLQGRPQDAVQRLEGLTDQDNVDTQVVTVLARALGDAGAHDRALRLAEAVLTRVRAAGNTLSLGEALLVRGMILALQGHFEDAHASLLEALEVSQDTGDLYLEGRILHTLGTMTVQSGDAQLGRDQIEQALTIFRTLGARKDSEKAEQSLQVVNAGIGTESLL